MLTQASSQVEHTHCFSSESSKALRLESFPPFVSYAHVYASKADAIEVQKIITTPRHTTSMVIKFQGSNRFGSLGKRDARRMLFSFKNNINTRSNPIPPPP